VISALFDPPLGRALRTILSWVVEQISVAGARQIGLSRHQNLTQQNSHNAQVKALIRSLELVRFELRAIIAELVLDRTDVSTELLERARHSLDEATKAIERLRS
jgi:hypothetical protein